jgi:hypothetical protein
MTNEQILEELYFKAHKNGFIDNFRSEIEILRKENKSASHLELAECAYKKCKKSTAN